ESAKTRELTRKQQAEQIAKAKAAGIEFFQLPATEKARLIELAAPIYEKWGKKIGPDYLARVRAKLGN
ncbi:hypothetical protein EDC39_1323, partial [Geothermobacter ehrlichii]